MHLSDKFWNPIIYYFKSVKKCKDKTSMKENFMTNTSSYFYKNTKKTTTTKNPSQPLIFQAWLPFSLSRITHNKNSLPVLQLTIEVGWQKQTQERGGVLAEIKYLNEHRTSQMNKQSTHKHLASKATGWMKKRLKNCSIYFLFQYETQKKSV